MKNILILWGTAPIDGKVEAIRCSISKMSVTAQGSVAHDHFEVAGENDGLLIAVDNIAAENGICPALVTIRSQVNPFTFKVSDVTRSCPIYIPEYNVIVTEGDDTRTYAVIKQEILNRNQKTILQKIESEPEENFRTAAASTINNPCPTWLGVSRDVRLFEVGFRSSAPGSHWPCDGINVNQHYTTNIRYEYTIGRGVGPVDNLKRGLEDSYLPIVNSEFTEGDITYSAQFFATLERSALKMENISGTHYLVADSISIGRTLTPEQEKEKDALWADEMTPDEETVLYMKVTAENKTGTPKYSWLRLPQPVGTQMTYDPETGFEKMEDGNVCMVALAEDGSIGQVEIAKLIQPGEKATFYFLIPHSPLSEERAKALAQQDYNTRLNECKAFWQKKLDETMQISLPEKRIENMMKAGLFHLDLICYGKEPAGVLAPEIGVYSAIGSESSPIIQYLSSCGATKTAQRALDFFYAKQHEDGFMQNFGGYKIENGAVLWTTYLYMLYSNDLAWIKSRKEQILKACNYLLDWIERNKKDELKEKGYGMLDGQVADPTDPFHSYMLNAYAYAGLVGTSKMMEKIGCSDSEKIANAAAELKENILKTLARGLADAPVIPLSNGCWCPSISPWPESTGPVALYIDGGTVFTHGTITARDACLGAMYLLYMDVVDKDSVYYDFIMNSYSELFFERHVAYSQPFYSQHGLVNLKRNEKKAFLKEFYNSFSALADKETYTFWEHLCHVSPHKTHEEGWFLMKCRNMLYSEELDEADNKLLIMPGVPSEWLLTGEPILLKGANSYYGPLSYCLTHTLPCKKLSLSLSLEPYTAGYPKVIIKLPLPANMAIDSVSIGTVAEGTNDIIIDNFNGNISLDITLKDC